MMTTEKKTIFILFILSSLGLGMKAQSVRNIEFQLEAGGGTAKHGVTNYHFNLSSGYLLGDRMSMGVGVGYINFNNRKDLNSGMGDGKIETGNHNAWRPFLYGKYHLLPGKRVNPFVQVKLGYAFFPDQKFNLAFDKNGKPYGGPQLPNQDLRLKGGAYTTVDVGVSRRLGEGGTKLYVSLSYDLQPLTYTYLSQNVKKNISSFGTNIGIVF